MAEPKTATLPKLRPMVFDPLNMIHNLLHRPPKVDTKSASEITTPLQLSSAYFEFFKDHQPYFSKESYEIPVLQLRQADSEG